MPTRTEISVMNCSLARSLGAMGDAWSFLIVRDLLLGATRFVELRESLGIARNVLTQRLAALQAAGVIARGGTATRPVYRLTESGYDLVPALLALLQWGDRWLAHDGVPVLLRGPDGVPLDRIAQLRAGGRPLAPGDVSASPGPGADDRTRAWLGGSPDRREEGYGTSARE